jgi:hypothetical protein
MRDEEDCINCEEPAKQNMCSDDLQCVQQERIIPLNSLDSDQLLSAMTLADRERRFEDFRLYRTELIYRLRCAEPLINWYKPTRI